MQVPAKFPADFCDPLTTAETGRKFNWSHNKFSASWSSLGPRTALFDCWLLGFQSWVHSGSRERWWKQLQTNKIFWVSEIDIGGRDVYLTQRSRSDLNSLQHGCVLDVDLNSMACSSSAVMKPKEYSSKVQKSFLLLLIATLHSSWNQVVRDCLVAQGCLGKWRNT